MSAFPTPATFTRLHDEWVARVCGPKPEQGTHLRITRRDGTTLDGYVTIVVWSGLDRDGHPIHLCRFTERARA